jgi:hypothetical protein
MVTREQRHTTKTSDIMGRQHDGFIEGPKMAGERAAEPAIRIDIIRTRLQLFWLSGKVCKFWQGVLYLLPLAYRCHQTAYVQNIAESRYNMPVTINALTIAFDCARSRMQVALAHWLDEPAQ